MNILKVLRGTWWGGNPQTLLIVYRGLIRSTMEYNAFLIKVEDQKLKTKIKVIQNQALRLAMGYRISTPINVMFAEAGEPISHVRNKLLADKFSLKLISLQDHPLQDKLCALKVEATSKNQLQTYREKYTLLDSFITQFYTKRRKIALSE